MKLTALESPEIACLWIKLQKKNNDSQIKHFSDSFRPEKFFSSVNFLQAVYKLFVRFKLFLPFMLNIYWLMLIWREREKMKHPKRARLGTRKFLPFILFCLSLGVTTHCCCYWCSFPYRKFFSRSKRHSVGLPFMFQLFRTKAKFVWKIGRRKPSCPWKQ